MTRAECDKCKKEIRHPDVAYVVYAQDPARLLHPALTVTVLHYKCIARYFKDYDAD